MLRTLEENKTLDAIAGAVHTLRVLADGTVAVTLHFLPKDRVAAMTMMGSPGSPIGCARLVDGVDKVADKPRADARGPLCMEAIGLAANDLFQEFAARTGAFAPDQAGAKAYILASCGVESRKELDTNAEAAEKFADLRRRLRLWAAGIGPQ